MLRLSYRNITEEEFQTYLLIPLKHPKKALGKISHPILYYSIPVIVTFLKPLVIYIATIVFLKIMIEDIKSFVIIGIYIFIIYILFIFCWKFYSMHKQIIKFKKYYSDYIVKHKNEIKNRKAEVLHLRSEIVFAVEDLKNFRRGYLHFAGKNSFVYISTDNLEKFEDIVPTNELIIERLPNLKYILKLTSLGEKIKVKNSIKVKNLPMSLYKMPECEIFAWHLKHP